MIIGCINTYNDYPLIIGCIKSIYNKVDKIIVVDGRYRDFPDCGNGWFSTDGTLEYLYSLDKVRLLFGANLFQADKRNIYINELNEGDMVLILDSDEIVEGNIEELPKEIDIGLIGFKEKGIKIESYLATRFFRFRKGLAYNGIHFILEIDGKWFNNRRHAINGFTDKKIQSFKINHLHKQRDKTRKLYKAQYYKTSGLHEAQYKKDRYE